MRTRFACDSAFLKLAVALMFAGIFIYPLAAQNSPTTASSNTVTLSYMGTAGWETTDGKTVVLVDPYLTRLKTNTPNDSALDSDPRPSACIRVDALYRA